MSKISRHLLIVPLILATAFVLSPAVSHASNNNGQEREQERNQTSAETMNANMEQNMNAYMNAGSTTASDSEDNLGMENRHESMAQDIEDRATQNRQEVEKRTEERVRQIASSTASTSERQQNKIQFRAEIAQKRADNASLVITATIERLSNIADRVDSRIQKVKDAGGNVTTAEAYLAAARGDLSAAKTSVAKFDKLGLNLASYNASSTSPQIIFDQIKVIASETKDYIRSAHDNLAKAVSTFFNQNGNEATSSANEGN